MKKVINWCHPRTLSEIVAIRTSLQERYKNSIVNWKEKHLYGPYYKGWYTIEHR